jgi:hypothetical protein
MLKMALVFNRRLEQDFFQTNKLSVVAFWLLTIDARHINYDLYLKLYELFQCLSVRRVREHLLDDILMNCEIWARASKEDHCQVVWHWAHILLRGSKEILVTVRPFSLLLSHFQLYFGFDRSEHLDIPVCRAHLRTLMLVLAHVAFDRTAYEGLVSHIVRQRDVPTCEELLQLLKHVLIDAQAYGPLTLRDLCPLLALLERGVPRLTHALLDVVLELSRSEVLPQEALPEFIQLFLLRIRPPFDGFFEFACVEARTHFSHAIALPFWYVAVIDRSRELDLLEQLRDRPFPFVTQSILTMFWPIVLAIQSEKAVFYFMSFASAASDWFALLAIVEVVCGVVRANLDAILALLLNAILNKLLHDGADLTDFFHVAAFLVSCRPNQAISPGLTELFDASPFADDPETVTEDVTERDVSILDCRRFGGAVHFSFAFRIDGNLKWHDSAFVTKLLAHRPSEADRYPRVRQLLSDMVGHQADVIRRGASHEALVSYPNALSDIAVLEALYQEKRAAMMREIQAELADLHRMATEKADVIISHTHVYVDAGISARMHEYETVWWRFWLPMSMPGSPWECEGEKHWKRLPQLSAALVPVLIGWSFKRVLHRPLTTLSPTNRLSAIIRYKCTYYEFDCATDGQIFCSPLGIILSLPEAVHLISPSEITSILKRLPCSLEIFTRNRRSFLFEIDGAEAPDVIDRILALFPSAELSVCDDHAMTQLWRAGSIPNFSYLLHLNISAGRSFHNHAIYPIFPAVVTESPSLFRDLEIPVDLAHAHTDQCYLFSEGPLPSSAVRNYLAQSSLDLSSTRFELIPELFCLPALFSKSTLPSWAKTAIDFCYALRKALESSEVSRSLHHWIDRLFGARQRDRQGTRALYKEELYEAVWAQILDFSVRRAIEAAGCLPRRIFRDFHAPRAVLEAAPPPFLFTRFNSGFRSAIVTESSLAFLDENGSLQLHQININEQGVVLFAAWDLQGADLSASDCLIAGRRGDFFVLVPLNFPGYCLLSQRTGRVLRVAEHFSVASVAVSGGVTAAIGANTVSVYRDDSFAFAVHSYRAPITCACVSDMFGIIVVGAADGALTLFETGTGLLLREIDLKGAVPDHVAVTTGFGFIVAAVTNVGPGEDHHFLEVYTINGEFVRRREIPGRIEAWDCCTSWRGVDFIVFAVDKGERAFRAAEVFWLDFTVFPHAGSRIVALAFCPEKACFLVCQAEGVISIVGQTGEQIQKRHSFESG